MNDEPISWSVTAKVYWAIIWRTLLMYFVCYAPFTLWIMLSGHIDEQNYFYWRIIVAQVLAVGAGFIALRMALRKRYRGFRFQIEKIPVS